MICTKSHCIPSKWLFCAELVVNRNWSWFSCERRRNRNCRAFQKDVEQISKLLNWVSLIFGFRLLISGHERDFETDPATPDFPPRVYHHILCKFGKSTMKKKLSFGARWFASNNSKRHETSPNVCQLRKWPFVQSNDITFTSWIKLSMKTEPTMLLTKGWQCTVWHFFGSTYFTVKFS